MKIIKGSTKISIRNFLFNPFVKFDGPIKRFGIRFPFYLTQIMN